MAIWNEKRGSLRLRYVYFCIKRGSLGVRYGYLCIKRGSLGVRYGYFCIKGRQSIGHGCWFFKGHSLGLDKTVSSSKHLVRG